MTSSLLTASTSSIPEPCREFRGRTDIEGGEGRLSLIVAVSRRSGLVSSILGRTVVRSLNVVLLRAPLVIVLLCEYVDRTRDHVCSVAVLVRAHSYLSYFPTKIQPPPSPRRASTCHFPRTPLGSRSNLHSFLPVSVSMMRVLRTACVSRLMSGMIRGRSSGVVDERRRWTWRLCDVCLPGFTLCGGRTRRYCCDSSENDIAFVPLSTDSSTMMTVLLSLPATLNVDHEVVR